MEGTKGKKATQRRSDEATKGGADRAPPIPPGTRLAVGPRGHLRPERTKLSRATKGRRGIDACR